MAKGKSTWKYNKLLTARRNYFSGYGPSVINRLPGGVSNISRGYGVSNIGKPITPTPWAGPTTTPPSTINTNVPNTSTTGGRGTGGGTIGAGPNWAGIAGLALTGAMDTMKAINNASASDSKEILKGINDATNASRMSLQPTNDSFDALAKDYASYNPLEHVNSKTLGAKNFGQIAGEGLMSGVSAFGAGAMINPLVGGIAAGASTLLSIGSNLFGNSRRKKMARKANRLIDRTNSFNERSLANRGNNLIDSQMNNMLANYAAYGGPIGGAIDYGFMSDYLEAKRMATKGKDKSLTSMPNSFATGGQVHGADWTNGLLSINTGKSHEENPYEGVPMGVDQEGTPNLVEEGETIFNDYVFSKRLMAPKAIRNKYRLGGIKNLSFADMSKELAKESEERPNDPISKRGLEAMMGDLAMAQEELKMKREAMNNSNMAAFGGNLFDKGGRKRNSYKGVAGYTDKWFDSNGKYTKDYLKMVENRNTEGWNRHFNNQYNWYHNASEEDKKTKRYQAIKNFYEANPDFDVPDIELTPDEVKWARKGSHTGSVGFMHTWGDDDSAATSSMTKDPITEYYLRGADKSPNGTPLDPYKTATRLGEDFSPDTPGYNWVEDKTVDENGQSILRRYYTKAEEKAAEAARRNLFNTGDDKNPNWQVHEGDIVDLLNQGYRFTRNADGDYFYEKPKDLDLGRDKFEWLRYAPAVGFGISALTDLAGLTNRPDYSNANALLEATRGAGTYQPVGFKPIGDYLTYNPFDRDYYINKANAEAGATRRNIMNTSAGNRGAAMAGLLAADYNSIKGIGELARQGEEYNLAQRQAVTDFNRATNMANSEGFLKADMANQEALAKQRDFQLKGLMAGYEMRDRARLAADAAKSANLSGLFQTLGDIGYEAKSRNMYNRMVETLGLPGSDRLTKDRDKNTAAKGGKLKRRKGLTR